MEARGPITFVLGAGASVPYLYDTGAALVKRIVSFTKDKVSEHFKDGDCESILASIGLNPSAMPVFQERLRRSQLNSIDDFLGCQRYDDLQKLGKFLIATALLPIESNRAPATDGDWYRWLINKISARPGELLGYLESVDINFVTFNYDSSLERTFRGSFRAQGVPAARIDNWLDKHILHVHGSIGDRSALNPYGSRDWDSMITHQRISAVQAAMSKIRVIHEIDQFPDSKTIGRWLESATQIVFLGFGFHEQNCAKLFANCRRIACKVYASGFGLEASERADAESLLSRYARLEKGEYVIGARDLDNLAFLRTHVRIT